MEDEVNAASEERAGDEAAVASEIGAMLNVLRDGRAVPLPPRLDLKDTVAFVDANSRPLIVGAEEPGTGVEAPLLVAKDGVKALPAAVFDDYRAQPKRRQGRAVLTTLGSLIAHVNRFRDEDSALFAVDDRTKPSITAVLDYHRAGADAAPRFGRHVAHFAFPLSDEWKAWTATDGKIMSMVEFAAFLEDRIIDVIDLIPGEDSLAEDLQRFVNATGGKFASAARLLELSRGLQVNERAVVAEAVNLTSGEGRVQFQSEHVDAAGVALNVPGLFLIAVPVFRGDALYRVAARLRYRKSEGRLVFWYELWRPDRTFDHAFNMGCERVRVETALPLMFGTPEAA